VAEDEFTMMLDDASEDITASAGTLDAVPRLGPNRANPKWCAKARAAGKIKVKRVVLGISIKCKELIPVALETGGKVTKAKRTKARELATGTIRLFVSTLPPLASDIARLAALSTLSGRGEDLLDAAGDMWIGILQLVQGIRHLSDDEVKEGAVLISSGAQTLLKLLPVLTADDDRKRTEKQVKADEASLTAEAKVNEAIREVEKLAKEEETRKRRDSIKRKADLKRAAEEAEKEASKQRAKDEAEAKRKAKQEELAAKRRAKEEEAKRKKDAEVAEREARRTNFKKSIARFETLSRGTKNEDMVSV